MVVIKTSLLSIAQLDWAIKQKGKIKYGICVRICSKDRLFYAVRAGTELEETLK